MKPTKEELTEIDCEFNDTVIIGTGERWRVGSISLKIHADDSVLLVYLTKSQAEALVKGLRHHIQRLQAGDGSPNQ